MPSDTLTGIFIDSLGTHKDTIDYFFIIKPEEPIRVKEFSIGSGIRYFPFKHLMLDVAIKGKWVELLKEGEGGEENLYCDIYYRFNNDSLKHLP